MLSEKKKSKEDTWKPADLKKYLTEDGQEDGRRQADRKYRVESVDKHTRDPEKEPRREGDKHIRGDAERRKEGSRDRRSDKERDSRGDRDKDKDREKRREGERIGDYRDKRDRRKVREETRDGERDKEQHREKDKDKIRQVYTDEERSKRREEREKDKGREERERRHDRDRRRHVNIVGEGSGSVEKHNKERRERDRQKDEYEVNRNEKDRRERRVDKKHAEVKEEREYAEERGKDKDERERRHKERGYHREKQKHHSESREPRNPKGSGEEVRHQRSGQEEAGREKPRELRPNEEKDPERNPRERTREKEKKYEPPDLSHAQKTEETQIVNDEEEAEQEYEDDFEDYEEDFEDLDDCDNDEEEKQELVEEPSAKNKEEIKAIQRAIDEENKKIETALSRQNTADNEEDRPKWSRDSERNQSEASHRGKFMDFVAAKQREVNKNVATKQKKRSTELLRLIDLDFSLTSSLLDMPPVNEYDMYIRSFGTANTKQAYVQCNEDNADRDIQTEEIDLCEKWTQHPPEHNGACGDPNLSRETRDRTMHEMNIDSKRLTAFMQSASQVMIVLLEEDRAERNSIRKLKPQTDILSFSDGSLQLNTKLPFLSGRPISLIHFSQVQKHTMISVHNPTTKPSAVSLDSYTVICIWNIWEPSRPQKILVYESEVHCCCFSPGKATLVFAGTSVGSVVLWDLREHASNHYHMTFGENEWTFRHPSFSTDAVMAVSGHFSTVMSVEVVPSVIAEGLRSEVPFLASEEESSGLSFQLASLDESGILNFWVVVELPKASEAGSQTDLGLRPGGKVKLLHSSSLSIADRVSPHKAVKTAPFQTLQLKFLPIDSNHFFIGTNMGIVHHGTSHGLKTLPKFYRYQEGEVRPVDVNSINFSPFRGDLFLVGCGDGSIRLHAVSQEQPLVEWRNATAGEPVVSLQWSQTRPTVFCVLDAASKMHLWDLLKNETEPVITESMNTNRVTAMALFGDSRQQNTYSGVALAHESGKIEMQYFTKTFTVPSLEEEEEMLKSLINEAL